MVRINYETLNHEEKQASELDIMKKLESRHYRYDATKTTVMPGTRIKEGDMVRIALKSQSWRSNDTMLKYNGCWAKALKIRLRYSDFSGTSGNTVYTDVPNSIVTQLEIIQSEDPALLGDVVTDWLWGWYHFDRIEGPGHSYSKLEVLTPPGIPL